MCLKVSENIVWGIFSSKRFDAGKILFILARGFLACVASVSVGFPHVRCNFCFFGSGKIGVGAKKCVVVEGKGEKETLARKPNDFEKRPFDTFTVG